MLSSSFTQLQELWALAVLAVFNRPMRVSLQAARVCSVPSRSSSVDSRLRAHRQNASISSLVRFLLISRKNRNVAVY